MTAARHLAPPFDDLDRKVLFAVELVDPVAQVLVFRGVKVRAKGIEAKPIVNASGRFVWLEEKDRWPEAISFEPGRLPFAAHLQQAPPRPPDLEVATPAERLVRIVLRPTPAYAFDAGVTAVRGRLCEDRDGPSPPIAGARVQLAWHDMTSNKWIPPPPAPDDSGIGAPRDVETDDDGEFAAFLRLPTKLADPDLTKDGMLAVRLQFTRSANPVTRVTPADFPFLPGAPTGRVPEGRLLERDLRLGWWSLTPI